MRRLFYTLLTLTIASALVALTACAGAHPAKERAKKESATGTPQETAPTAEPIRVLMKTSKGSVTLELYPDKAPKTVENFLSYVDEGSYDNTLFHRVIPRFMVQGGGFEPGMKPKETHAPIKNEADNGLHNRRGTIAMARTLKPDSATAQFFINVADNSRLDFRSKDLRGWGYCVFGKVVKGMRNIDRIAKGATTSRAGHHNVPVKEVVIRSIRRLKAKE